MSRQIMPRRLFAVSLAMLLCPTSIRSQAAPARTVAQAPLPDRLAIDSGRAIMLRGMARAGTPGSSVTVMRAGKIVWSQGLGLADVENRVPVTTLTKFRIGSVSKSLTASAVGLLVEILGILARTGGHEQQHRSAAKDANDLRSPHHLNSLGLCVAGEA